MTAAENAEGDATGFGGGGGTLLVPLLVVVPLVPLLAVVALHMQIQKNTLCNHK